MSHATRCTPLLRRLQCSRDVSMLTMFVLLDVGRSCCQFAFVPPRTRFAIRKLSEITFDNNLSLIKWKEKSFSAIKIFHRGLLAVNQRITESLLTSRIIYVLCLRE